MKLDILLVEILLVIMVVLPYITFAFLAFREREKLKLKFRLEMENRNFTASHKGSWNNNMIAVDFERSALLLVQQYDSHFDVTYTDLKKVIKVSTLIVQKKIKINGREEERLEQVCLEFECVTGTFNSLSLYDAERTYQQDLEVKNAEEWCMLINTHIKLNPILGAAA